MSISNRILHFSIFSLTCVCASVYLMVWSRQANLVFGMSIYDYSVVLATLVGGLALGNLMVGRYTDSHANPLRLLAYLQLGLVLWGAMSHLTLSGLVPIFTNSAQSLTSDSTAPAAVPQLLSMLVALPTTLLVGAAFPVMARSLVKEDGIASPNVGILYATGALGAAIGVSLTDLFLSQAFGPRGAIFMAVVLNMIAGTIVWGIAGRSGEKPDKISGSRESTALKQDDENYAKLVSGFVSFAYTLSGLVSMGYTIVWMRLLSTFTANAPFSLSFILTTILIGTALGGWIASWRLGKRLRQKQGTEMGQFVDLQIWLGLSALGTLFVFSWLANANLKDIIGQPSLRAMFTYELMVSFLTLLAPSIFIGMIFPIVISLVTQERSSEVGRIVGRINGLNLIGAVLGSFLAGFGLVPLLGFQASGAILACVSLVIGFVASWIARAKGENISWLPHAGIAFGIALVLLLPEG